MDNGIKVLVVARKKETLLQYQNLVSETGVRVEAAESLQDAMFAAIRNSYNGLLIDVPTIIQAGEEEKKHLHDLLEVYPAGKVRISPSTSSVSVISAGKCRTKAKTVEEFITEECGRFKARSCRSSERKPLNLAVILSSSAEFQVGDIEKSFTVNVSHGGCFVFSVRHWQVGDSVWIRLQKSAGGDTLMTGEVRWTVNWGESQVIPGIGVCFRKNVGGLNL